MSKFIIDYYDGVNSLYFSPDDSWYYFIIAYVIKSIQRRGPRRFHSINNITLWKSISLTHFFPSLTTWITNHVNIHYQIQDSLLTQISSGKHPEVVNNFQSIPTLPLVGLQEKSLWQSEDFPRQKGYIHSSHELISSELKFIQKIFIIFAMNRPEM